VGCGNAIHLVTKYDHHVNEIIPFLMKGWMQAIVAHFK
jgi:hypothetical protein